jgi:hypothetical protein
MLAIYGTCTVYSHVECFVLLRYNCIIIIIIVFVFAGSERKRTSA